MAATVKPSCCLLGLFIVLLIVVESSTHNLRLRIILVDNFEIEFSSNLLQKFYRCLCSNHYSTCKVSYKQMSKGFMMVDKSGSVEGPSDETDFVCNHPKGNGTEFICSRQKALKDQCDGDERCKFSFLKATRESNCPMRCISLGWTDFEVRYELFCGDQVFNANCDGGINVDSSPPSAERCSLTAGPETSTSESTWTSTTAVTENKINVKTIGLFLFSLILAGLMCLFVVLIICRRKRQNQFKKSVGVSKHRAHSLTSDEIKMEWRQNQDPSKATVTQVTLNKDNVNDKYTAYVASGHAYNTISEKSPSPSEDLCKNKKDSLDAKDLKYSNLSKSSCQVECAETKCQTQEANFYSWVDCGRKETSANIPESVMQAYDGAEGISHRSFIKRNLLEEKQYTQGLKSTKDECEGISHVYSRLNNGRQERQKETSRSFLETYDGPVVTEDHRLLEDYSKAGSSKTGDNVYSRLDNGRKDLSHDVSDSVFETYC